ncbi:MAG: hypothetical protein H6Q67_2045 [Firmicutes bacterium]|nr:hypothetical protein [Bacillota bacterium]
MIKRRSNTQSISWFGDQSAFGRLDMEPPYQRLSVWSSEYKKFFIDSVLNNFPCPTIFLNIETNPDGKTIYHVIDGKQRLTAIFEFIKDGFKTAKNANYDIADKYFSELTEAQRTEFFEYTFTVENISGATTTVLNDVFDRLNRNVAKLTDQELRHAKYSGEFISLVEALAGDPIWKDLGIATPANVRRMKDIEFVSEIFLLTMHGILDGKAQILDKYYAELEEAIPDVDVYRERYELCKRFISDLDFPFRDTRLSNYADFYSLWAAVDTLQQEKAKIDIEKSKESLLNFINDLNMAQSGDGEGSKAYKYLNAARQGSNKAQNRKVRSDLLKECFVIQ